MKKAIYGTLTESEKVLVADTAKEALTELDEDALLELLTRVRRARTKYVTLYRRRASAQVADSGGRGLAHEVNQRDRDKAEVFERSLSRVSRQVQLAAKQAADQLRTERLEAAQSVTGSGPDESPSGPKASRSPGKGGSGKGGSGKGGSRKGGSGKAGSGKAGSAKAGGKHVKTTGGLKKDASTKAQGARRQAKRDAR